MRYLEPLRRNPELFRDAVVRKGIEDVDVDAVLALDADVRARRQVVERLRAEQKKLARNKNPAVGGEEAADQVIERGRELRRQIADLTEELTSAEADLQFMLDRLPGILAPEVPLGMSDESNVELWRWREPNRFDFRPRDHLELMEHLGLVELDAPRVYAGARSYALTGGGALLEQAVMRLAFDVVVANGFTPVRPPTLVRSVALYGTGFFPGSQAETYQLPNDDSWLTGTSEVGLVALQADSMLELAQLPLRYVGWSTCFRREAGAAGRDTRGLYRVHEFMKVEQVVIAPADMETTEAEHMRLLANSESVLQLLELPYRVALACGGETGIGQYRKHEVETWFPGRGDGGAYGETHSCSTLLDFQSRRSNIRYRNADGRPTFAHTLNNTAVASPRILVALVENHQLPDGSVAVPEALRPYMYGIEALEPGMFGSDTSSTASAVRLPATQPVAATMRRVPLPTDMGGGLPG